MILVVSEKEKDTSSTSGMETSKNTSDLLTHRAACIVDKRMEGMKQAYLERDFETFGQLTMRDSNQFHATCLDTYPPIFYMNDTSHDIIKLVHVINRVHGRVICAYTFDAGPNAVIYTLKEHIPMLVAVFSYFFPVPQSLGTPDYCNNPTVFDTAVASQGKYEDVIGKCRETGRARRSNDVQYVFVTQPGCGPVLQPLEESVIDLQTGLFKAPSSKHRRLVIGGAHKQKEGKCTGSSACTSSASCGTKCCALDCKWAVALGVIATLGFVFCRHQCHK